MGTLVKASDIASFLKTTLYGTNINISGVSALNSIEKNTLTFSKKNYLEDGDYSNILILVPLDFEKSYKNINFIKTENPRLSFARIIENFFIPDKKQGIHKYVDIGPNCTIPNTVSIGAYSIIGRNVIIGENTIINNNVVIYDNTIIGSNCYIKSGSIIGEDGFGFDFDSKGKPIRIPHVGKVVIKNNVEIGSKNTIARGTIGNTIIHDYVKTDDQVHIAHNCTIGENTIITACAEISGSVTIGKSCWIGPNSSIMQKVLIGDYVTIGLGTIVTKNIPTKTKVMGLIGLELKKLIKLQKRIEFGK